GDNDKKSNATDGNSDKTEIDEHSHTKRVASNEENSSSSSEDSSFESYEREDNE
ncbi:unnamed protein product, partial [Dovyalis caffra]